MDTARPANLQPTLLATLERLLAIEATALEPALDEASTLIAAALGADKVDTFLYESASHSLVAVGTSTTPLGQQQHALGLDRLPLANGGRAVEVFQTGQVYHHGQVDTDQGELRGIREALGVRSTVVVPLEVGGVRRGVVQADAVEPQAFTADHCHFFLAVARWVGLIIARVELHEQRTQAAMEQARRLAADELITVLAHDLGNALTPLVGRVYVLRRRAERAGRTADVAQVAAVEQGLHRLHRRITDLLDVGRIEQGLFAIVRQPVNLAELARETVDDMRTAQFAITVEAPDEVLAEVDPNRIRQALENLLANARTHAAGSPVVVTVGQEARPDGAWAVLRVADQGPGMAPDVLAQLTERFVRGPHSRGLGLGLYLARGSAEAHGGTLTAASAVGVGTTFALALPLQAADAVRSGDGGTAHR